MQQTQQLTTTGAPDDQDDEHDVEDAKSRVEDFLHQTEDGRGLSEKCRDYYDNKQWSDHEASKLTARGQAPIVVNRIKSKVEGLKGLHSLRKTDPKAYPRTKHHEESAHAITDALRYVADSNDLDTIKDSVADNFFVEGYAGAIVHVKQKKKTGEIDIVVEGIPWDRIYFDPHSRKRDFSDARYKGLVMWMDEEELYEHFEDFDPANHMEGNSTYETFEDRPRWIMRNKKRTRYRVAYDFYMNKGEWWMCIFTEGGYLIKPQVSPFLDDDGEPCCPIELVSAYIDRENNRYSEVASFLDQQDEINHRRSKALHLLSRRQTFGRKGEQSDVQAIKKELAKPDGHVEFLGEEFGKDFGILPTTDMLQGQFDLYQDAKQELDSISFNAQLAGERQSGDLSGKAIDRLQQAGTIELNSQYNALNGWEKRIYRQIWARIKQFWTEEKWIRVTDDQDNLRWVGLNSQVTVGQLLEETSKDESKPKEMRIGAQAVLQEMTQTQDPRLNEIVEVSNPIPEIDCDIILDQSFDVINVQQEQFQLLAQFAQGQDIDVIELIELSQLRGKDELIEKIQKRRQAAAETNGGAAQIEAAKVQSEIELNKAKAEAEMAKAKQTDKTADLAQAKELALIDLNNKKEIEIHKANLKQQTDSRPQTVLQVDTDGAMEKVAQAIQTIAAAAAETTRQNAVAQQETNKALVDTMAALKESSAVTARNTAAPRSITTPEGKVYTATVGTPSNPAP